MSHLDRLLSFAGTARVSTHSAIRQLEMFVAEAESDKKMFPMNAAMADEAIRQLKKAMERIEELQRWTYE